MANTNTRKQPAAVFTVSDSAFNDTLNDPNLGSMIFLGDAGTQSTQYYAKKLSPFQNRVRNWLLPYVQAETPIVAKIQTAMRNPLLDSYFMSTANLGSHTFYVLFLPVSFWLGYPQFGWNLFFELAIGVYFTNFWKDFLCLPRPLSPPLQRLTMSKDAALEYGFPSTHTANAVSVFLLVADTLKNNYFTETPAFSTPVYILLNIANILYILSLAIGRIYCGMHGFLDVLGGLVIGAFIFWISPIFLNIIFKLTWTHSNSILFLIPLILFLISKQPKPADCCPCFDDSIAFLGVLVGLVLSEWTFWNLIFNEKGNGFEIGSEMSWLDKMYTHTQKKYYLEPGVLRPDRPGILNCVLRIVIGIVMVLVWKVLMKKVTMTILPFVWEKLGIEKKKEKKSVQKIEENEKTGLVRVHQTSQTVLKQRATNKSQNEDTMSDSKNDDLLIQIPFRSWYEAEVVSKLIVYAGIAWVVLCPSRYVFSFLGI